MLAEICQNLTDTWESAKILTVSWEMAENLTDSWDSSPPIQTLSVGIHVLNGLLVFIVT